MPTSAYDPELLREQETPLVIGKNWLLDQDIPAGGFVRIQHSSQVWEERMDETRIIATEDLTPCLALDPGRGWTITTGGWSFKKKQESLSVGKATSKHLLQLFGRRLNEQKSWRKLDTDHQCG